MQNWCVNPQGNTAERMIMTLAGMCNGASSWDGAGFSKMDTAFGHSLAERAAQGRAWTEKQAQGALKLINKYRRQIGGEAAIKAWMQSPVFAVMPLSDQERQRSAQNQRRLTSRDQLAVFQFPYDARLVSAIKGIRGEHKGKRFWAAWDAAQRVWTVPVNETSIQQIMTLAREWEFAIEERFETYYSRVIDKLQAVAGAAEESRVVTTLGYQQGVSVEDGTITIVHPDAQVLAEFRAALAGA